MTSIYWEMNKHKNSRVFYQSMVNKEEMDKSLSFHKSVPGYTPSPLSSLNSLANYLNIQGILVKDESFRFNLNSFKALGSSYAAAILLARECRDELKSFEVLKEKVKLLPLHTFATATDGNHGKGLAWASKIFGQKSVVYMPVGSSDSRLNAIRELGAEAYITEYNYDDTVRLVSDLSRKYGWTLVQDTAWENYTEIPTLIMQGYLTILAEIKEQLKEFQNKGITHVILQGGVGSFAGAIAGGLQCFAGTSLKTIVVEPTKADCLYQSACSKDGLIRNASGDLSTMMAGLSCGEPNPVSWDILKDVVDCFVSCPDEVTARGMRVLGNPLGKDTRIISGESGAVPLGLLFELCTNNDLLQLKNSLELDSSSSVLVINTEGNTDPVNYRKVCWNGIYPNI
ncbi:MAG: diaminopropionate ammonia-lyase [Clostridiales bacterium]|nr:diaminopropionate ammonia-lyase [Clostridiales bacterium]MCF8021777.1 diaminopropionate ammonia-lyase [Clostridiales bacterium]